MPSPINNSISYATAPPAYSEDAAPAPRYTPKKDFGKAFSDLQGRYGFDGAAPVLPSKDEKKQSKPKKHNFCIVKGLKSLLAGSSYTSTEKSKSSPARPARIPSPALRIIESGPTLSYNSATGASTYPLRPVSPLLTNSTSSTESAAAQAKKQRKSADKQAAKNRDSAVRTGLYGFDTGSTGRSPGA